MLVRLNTLQKYRMGSRDVGSSLNENTQGIKYKNWFRFFFKFTNLFGKPPWKSELVMSPICPMGPGSM